MQKFIRLTALSMASLVGFWLAMILYIILAHLVVALKDVDDDANFEFLDIYMTSFIILAIISVIIAWYKNLWGGVLMTISAFALILSNLDDLHFGRWPQIILFIAGLVLIATSLIDKKR